MNKRGAEDLLLTVGLIVVLLAYAGSIIFFIRDASTGSAAKDEAIVKQVALLLDSARPGSVLLIGKNFDIEGNKIKTGIKDYEIFSNYNFAASSGEGGTEVKVG